MRRKKGRRKIKTRKPKKTREKMMMTLMSRDSIPTGTVSIHLDWIK
jgi:hypothetical protein